MSKYTLSLIIALAAFQAVNADAPREPFAGMTKLRPVAEQNGSLTANFSIKGGSALQQVATMNFDQPDSHGWTFQNDNDVTWSIKKGTAAKDFATINPDDNGSLYVDGPYQTFKRAKSTATSPEIVIPDMATLTFYVGFSLNYEDTGSLTLNVIDGEEVTPVWKSTDQKGEKPWAWRPYSVDLGAWAGKTVKLQFLYGAGTSDMFDLGGYMAEYYIDDIKINAPQVVENVKVTTGEKIELLDLSTNAVAWSWEMPGAVPATSTLQNPVIYYTTDGNYDITLTVTDADGNQARKTRTSFATVTGAAPVARILPPATFRNSENRLPLIAPQVPVKYFDASTGFPATRSWTFTGVSQDPAAVFTSSEENPEVAYAYLHNQAVGLEVENQHGKSTDLCEVSVEYSAVVTNFRPDDRATVKDMEDWGTFPGANTQKITAYAERFSKPSRPVVIDGAYVFFTQAEAKHVADQIANVCVRLCKSENGLPGEELDFMCWSVFELDLPQGGSAVGTAFPFTNSPVVDDEFFIVVDGLPEYNDSCKVSFAIAGFRSEGNTALMKKEGKWLEVPEYFGANGHTSFMIYPSLHHSVMNILSELPEEGILDVGADAGETEIEIFSYLGYNTPVDIDADWLTMTSTPNGMTVDTLKFAFDSLPSGLSERSATVRLTDGASNLSFIVRQSGVSKIAEISVPKASSNQIFDLLGRKLSKPSRGINIINGRIIKM